jgi:DNA-binding phage protein
VERIEVLLDEDEATALAAVMDRSGGDASVANHWGLGRTRLDGNVLSMHPKWAGVPIVEYLHAVGRDSTALTRVCEKVEATWG